MPWQIAARSSSESIDCFPISRCSSITALSLSGNSIRTIDNTQRRTKTARGYIYDTWAPWHVLSIQCHPDHRHTMDSHDERRRYVNGPEAFLITLLPEFKDAYKRFLEIQHRIRNIVTPPVSFKPHLQEHLNQENHYAYKLSTPSRQSHKLSTDMGRYICYSTRIFETDSYLMTKISLILGATFGHTKCLALSMSPLEKS